MKRILVKVGKVWSLIQRDGFFRALARTWNFFLSSLRRVGQGQILYITGGIGDSALYRGEHVCEELRVRGFACATTTQDNPFLLRYIDRFDVFVLHRVGCSRRIKTFLARAKQAKKTVLFETDDLTFDGARMRQTSTYENMNRLERSQYRDGLSQCVVRDQYVAYATTTTEPLAQHLRKHGKKVFVVPNKLSDTFIGIASKVIDRNLPKAVEGCFTIGYFSGSASHDRDFSSASNAIIDIMKQYPHVHLLIAGPLSLDRRFDVYVDRIMREPYMSREEYFQSVASCDINIAPLEIGDDFCESKSAIKYYEAGIVGVPIVASATHEFCNVIADGETGFVAGSQKEWYTKIERLIQDDQERCTMGERARADVLKKHTTRSQGNEAYYTFLRQQIDGSVREDLSLLQNLPSHVDTAVVIVNWDQRTLLERCLISLQKQKDQSFAVIVVDNGSLDGSLEMVQEKFSDVSWVELSANMGFAHPTNIGMRAALSIPQISYVIALNNDTECDEHFIGVLRTSIQSFENTDGPPVGALQPKVRNYFAKGNLDTTGIVTSFEMSALNRGIGEVDRGQYDAATDIFGPSGSAPLYTRAALETTMLPYAGYYDRDYFAYYEDVDLAWRLVAADYRVLFVPEALVFHVHSATGKKNSPFKAFHIHRNHFYNIIKNAPWYYLPILLVFVPFRYILVFLSVLKKSGPASRLHSTTKTHQKQKITGIVFKSWSDVLSNLFSLLRKRRFIAHTRVRSSYTFFRVISTHYVRLRDIIFK